MTLAHIKFVHEKEVDQTLKDHVTATATYAADDLASADLCDTGYVAGLLHDMGKAKEQFQRYLRAAANGEAVIRGSVNHTFAGLIWLWGRYHKKESSPIQQYTCEIISYAIGSHHGLFDVISEEGTDGFQHRLNAAMKQASAVADDIAYEESVSNFFEECTTETEVDERFENACGEIERFLQKTLNRDYFAKKADRAFATGLLCRSVVSALIDGDRKDSAEFMNDIKYPEFDENMRETWDKQLIYMESKMKEFPESPINHARSYISDHCKKAAKWPGGIYRLSVPTGSGKTLATLRYALAHNAENNKERIFFFIPLLSVTEQNAQVIREYVEDQNLILEHHSNVVHIAGDTDELDRYEVLTERWKNPLIVSTLVQLLNTLFSGKTTSVRRFQSLCSSTIIIDEVQSIPSKTISMLNNALNFLAYCCNTTVILCSATQPCFDQVQHPIRYGEWRDLVPFDAEIWEAFKRTNIVNRCTTSGYTLEEIRDFSLEIMEASRSLLVICNTRKEAFDLFGRLKLMNHSNTQPFEIYHLSTLMCMQNRLDTMKSIQDCLDLKQGKRVVVVATQLVEAGVDFSFETVIRICAGLDNVAQAAGRCNRSGDFGKLCNVYIMNLKDESLRNLPDIRLAQTSMMEFLFQFQHNQELFSNDMLSSESIDFYYKKLFSSQLKQSQFDYPVKKYNSSLFQMLSINDAFIAAGKADRAGVLLLQAFKTAGAEFAVFDDLTQDIIVPYDQKAEELIADLYSEKAEHDLNYLKELLAEAQPYTVSVFEYQVKKLDKEGGLHESGKMPFKTVLNMFYNAETGFYMDGYMGV